MRGLTPSPERLTRPAMTAAPTAAPTRLPERTIPGRTTPERTPPRSGPAPAPPTLDALVAAAADLPALSAAVGVVLAETGSGRATSNSVAAAILTDPGLAARVLRLANSAYYGLPREVLRMDEAVTVLGFRTVRSLVLVAGTYPLLKRPLESYRLDPEELWRFSGATAVAASLVAAETGAADADAAFGYGLLHDVGRLALDESLGDRLAAVLRRVESGESFTDAERAELGFDHAEVGAHLARGWNLPRPYVAAMRWHHRPDDAPETLAPEERAAADCVHIAAALALSLGHGLGVDGLNHALAPGAVARLNLDADLYDTLAIRFLETHGAQSPLLASAA